jgi:hypothetical protein
MIRFENQSNSSLDSRKTNTDYIFNCVSNNFTCTLTLSPAHHVSHLIKLLAQKMKHLPSELRLICRGRIISRLPKSTLSSLGLEVGGTYKLLVIRRHVTPAWLHITAYILCSSLPPIQIPMHASSPAADIKSEVRDLLRIPGLCLSLHLADGEPLPDGASLRDLGVRDGGRVYCRVHTEDPPPAAAVEAGRVREQIRRAEGGRGGGEAETGAAATGAEGRSELVRSGEGRAVGAGGM